MMIEAQLWHPVMASHQVREEPVACALLGQALVLWREHGHEGPRVHAWADRCPHRGAQLSLGRVLTGLHGARLECPYHGWQFGASGRCQHVPAAPDFVPPAGHAATVFEARERHGLVWVRLQTPTQALAAVLADPPAFAPGSDPDWRHVLCGPYALDTSAPRLVENFLDLSHFGFVHEGWLGSRDVPAIDDYRVEATTTGLLATGCKAWQPQSNLHSTAPAQVEYTYEVTAPYAAVLTKVPEAGTTAVDGWRESIALFICPITPVRSRVWFRLAVADFDSPDEKLQAFQHTIFTQDQPVLESQTPQCLPLDLRAELHTAADKASSAYRRFLRQSGITFGVC